MSGCGPVIVTARFHGQFVTSRLIFTHSWMETLWEATLLPQRGSPRAAAGPDSSSLVSLGGVQTRQVAGDVVVGSVCSAAAPAQLLATLSLQQEQLCSEVSPMVSIGLGHGGLCPVLVVWSAVSAANDRLACGSSVMVAHSNALREGELGAHVALHRARVCCCAHVYTTFAGLS